MEKEKLKDNIRKWIQSDADITKLKNEIKEKNKIKKELTDELITVMKQNSIDCFDINGGSLIYKTNKQKKPITNKLLVSTLQKFYEDDKNIADELTKFILDNREEITKETIKRKIEKINK